MLVSQAADSAYFGASPDGQLASDPALSKLRSLLLTVIAGFLLLAGFLLVSFAWFGPRAGATWALVSLGLAGIVAIGFWALSRWPCVRSGVALTLCDLPPFIWIPTALILPAIVLGWIG